MEYIIDVKNKKFGRVASEIAIILQGKKTPYYDPRLAGEGKVIVKNINKIMFSGDKLNQKKYYRHTGYIGHLKQKTLKEAFQKSPDKALRSAVLKMLPKNLLIKKRIKRLIVE